MTSMNRLPGEDIGAAIKAELDQLVSTGAKHLDGYDSIKLTNEQVVEAVTAIGGGPSLYILDIDQERIYVAAASIIGSLDPWTQGVWKRMSHKHEVLVLSIEPESAGPSRDYYFGCVSRDAPDEDDIWHTWVCRFYD